MSESLPLIVKRSDEAANYVMNLRGMMTYHDGRGYGCWLPSGELVMAWGFSGTICPELYGCSCAHFDPKLFPLALRLILASAFYDEGIERMWSRTAIANQQAVRVNQALGMRFAGRLAKADIYGNEVCDVLIWQRELTQDNIRTWKRGRHPT